VTEGTVSRSYAEALFELGEHHGQPEIERAVAQLIAVLDSTESVRRFLESPKIPLAAKEHALRHAFGHHVPRVFLSFLLVVVRKRRQRLLRDIAGEYQALLDEHAGRIRVDITLAAEPDERAEEEIAAALSRVLGKAVVPQIRADERILGGIIVRYGDRVLDGSLRRRLMALRRRLLQRSLTVTAMEP
jgi:F-type H+-transporting ATPase subunit delta